MKYENKIYVSLLWIILGLALVICNAFGLLQNDMWAGIGYGWLGCGFFQVLKQLRYRKDKTYREQYDIAVSDERNRFIAAKAWAWAGYGFVLIAGVTTLICLIIGQKAAAQITCGSMCLIVFLYWVSYLYLKRKY